MDKENMIELLEDFIDFLKDKEDEKGGEEKEVIVAEEDDNFNKAINKISKGE